VLLPCNWAQILEGAIDSAHSSSLHSSDMVPARVDGAKATDKTWLRPSTDKAPRMQVPAHRLRLPLRSVAPPYQNAGHARVCALHRLRGAHPLR
jgi:phthalate 4,5-dioxygenase oxygenase subunit